MDTHPKPAREYSVLSSATILILSGFLLGLSIAEPLGDLAYYVFSCGLTGLVAYLTFLVTSLQQERSAVHVDRQLMEARLQRHIHMLSTPAAQNDAEKNQLLEWLKRETAALAK